MFMQFLLIISLIAIVVIGITNYKDIVPNVRAGSINLKIGVFTLIVGIIILASSSIAGFGEMILMKQISAVCFLIPFLSIIVAIVKFVSKTSYTFNRKLMVFALITGFTYTIINEYFPFFNVLMPNEFNFKIVTFVLYIIVVACLIIEVYRLIFKSQVHQES
jgi:hypothetical protein